MGQKSMRTLATEFEVNVSNISRRAKKEGWIQDKSQEIKQRTNAALVAQRGRNTPTQEDIDKAVGTNIEIVTSHRKDIKESRSLVQLFQSQLRNAATNRDEIEGAIIDDTKGPDGENKPEIKRRNRMLKAVSLPAHAGVLKDLSVAQKNLIYLERQAYNLNESGEIEDVYVLQPAKVSKPATSGISEAE